MTTALLTCLAGDLIDIRSAGTETHCPLTPAEQIDPAAVAAMAQLGIDIAAAAKVFTTRAVYFSDVAMIIGRGNPRRCG
jgi:arsenate reductase (thioredoxin)